MIWLQVEYQLIEVKYTLEYCFLCIVHWSEPFAICYGLHKNWNPFNVTWCILTCLYYINYSCIKKNKCIICFFIAWFLASLAFLLALPVVVGGRTVGTFKMQSNGRTHSFWQQDNRFTRDWLKLCELHKSFFDYPFLHRLQNTETLSNFQLLCVLWFLSLALPTAGTAPPPQLYFSPLISSLGIIA